MGLVQTNLTKEEHDRFDEVKEFLFESKLIDKKSVYAAVKWMVVETCNTVAKRFVPEVTTESTVSEGESVPELETAILHGKEIPVIEAPELVEPITQIEPEEKKVRRNFVIGGIDFRPKN